MKKTYKSLSAIALAGAMIMGMNLTAFAAEGETQNTENTTGTIVTETIEVGKDNTATLTKALKVTNYDGYVYEPTITYTYTLGNGTAAGTVTDNNLTVNYKAGELSYLADPSAFTKTAVFDKANAVAAEDGISSRDLSWTFDPAAFPSAGVYRYTVSETTSAVPAEIGIVRDGAYDTEKFLDVYVQNEGNAQIIAGMVLVDDEENAVDTASAKSSGWNTGEDLESYTTYNMTVTKEITGAGADMTAKFPFTVTLNGEMGHANIATEGSDGTNYSQFTLGEDGKKAVVTGTLGHDGTLTVKGLPTTVTFNINEENKTADTYKATAAAEGFELTTKADKSDLVGNGNLDVASGAIAQASAKIDIIVTNNLDAISPTGVMLRYAPYILILAAGIVIFALSRRRREKED